MASYLLVIPLIVSFLITFLLIPFWIRKVKSIGLVWEDMNKIKSESVAGSGGMIVLLAFLISVLTYVAYRIFALDSHNGFLVEIFALMLMTVFMGFVGFIDDLFGWRHGGLTIGSRIMLSIFGAIPLIVINAGKSAMELPFFGVVDMGLLYPLFFIPLGVVATTTTFNMLAGFNGLESGQGILLLSALGLVAYLTGNSWLAVICLCMVLALIGFIYYNWSPARVFPGDVITYAIGVLIAAVTIVGNFEKIAVFFYIPYIIEVVLKSRGRLKKQSFGKPLPDGTLDNRYERIYSLNHVAIAFMKKFGIRSTEKRAVLMIWAFQLLIILIGFFIFRSSLF